MSRKDPLLHNAYYREYRRLNLAKKRKYGRLYMKAWRKRKREAALVKAG